MNRLFADRVWNFRGVFGSHLRCSLGVVLWLLARVLGGKWRSFSEGQRDHSPTFFKKFRGCLGVIWGALWGVFCGYLQGFSEVTGRFWGGQQDYSEYGIPLNSLFTDLGVPKEFSTQPIFGVAVFFLGCLWCCCVFPLVFRVCVPLGCFSWQCRDCKGAFNTANHLVRLAREQDRLVCLRVPGPNLQGGDMHELRAGFVTVDPKRPPQSPGSRS